jgi:hypothetical protein
MCARPGVFEVNDCLEFLNSELKFDRNVEFFRESLAD